MNRSLIFSVISLANKPSFTYYDIKETTLTTTTAIIAYYYKNNAVCKVAYKIKCP